MVNNDKVDLTNEELLKKLRELDGVTKSLDARNLRLPTLTIIGLVGFFVWGTYFAVTKYEELLVSHRSHVDRLTHLEQSHSKLPTGHHPHDHPEIESIDDKHRDGIRDLQYKWERFSNKHDNEEHHAEFVTESEFKLWCVRMQLKNPEWKCDPAIKKGMTYEDMRELERFWHKNQIRSGDLGG